MERGTRSPLFASLEKSPANQGSQRYLSRPLSYEPIIFDPIDATERPKLVRLERLDGSTFYTTPIISRKDIDTYLKPVYQRGCSIEYRRREPERPMNLPYHAPSLQLHFKDLTWSEFYNIRKFVRKLELKEKHPIEWKYDFGPHGPLRIQQFLGEEFPSLVALVLHTSSATLPVSSGASDRLLCRYGNFGLPLLNGGITLRDIRFAILLNDFLREYYSLDTENRRVKVTRGVKTNAMRPVTMDALLTGPRLIQPSEVEEEDSEKEERNEYGFLENMYEHVVPVQPKDEGYVEKATSTYYSGRDWFNVLDAIESLD